MVEFIFETEIKIIPQSLSVGGKGYSRDPFSREKCIIGSNYRVGDRFHGDYAAFYITFILSVMQFVNILNYRI